MIEVPLNLPIDASLPEERERARQVLERAAQAADMFNVKLTPVIVTARSAGKAIVEEAIARRSEVIVLGSQGKRRIADKVFGRTIDYVLDNLPCEAIINVIPKHAATGAVGAGAGGANGHHAGLGGRAARADEAEHGGRDRGCGGHDRGLRARQAAGAGTEARPLRPVTARHGPEPPRAPSRVATAMERLPARRKQRRRMLPRVTPAPPSPF